MLVNCCEIKVVTGVWQTKLSQFAKVVTPVHLCCYCALA